MEREREREIQANRERQNAKSETLYSPVVVVEWVTTIRIHSLESEKSKNFWYYHHHTYSSYSLIWVWFSNLNTHNVDNCMSLSVCVCLSLSFCMWKRASYFGRILCMCVQQTVLWVNETRINEEANKRPIALFRANQYTPKQTHIDTHTLIAY